MVALMLATSLVLGAPAPVTKVVLYPDRAQVTRAQPLTCPAAGSAGLRFAGLAPDFDVTTLTASATKGAKVTGVSLTERADAAGHDRKAAELKAKLLEVDDKLAAERRARERAEAQRAQGESLRAGLEPFLNRDAAAEKKPDLAQWKGGLDQAAQLIDDADARERASDAASRALEKSRDELSTKLKAMGEAPAEKVEDVEVALDCEAAGQVSVELSYLVANASWSPVYQARADEAAGKVALTVGGEVQQHTGEDWKGVEVVLSTGESRRDATAPELLTLHVGTSGEVSDRKVLVPREEAANQLASGADTTAARAPAAAKVEDQGLSVRLQVEGRPDVPGDGTAVRVPVETLALPATFTRLAAPRVVPEVFRVAKVTNAARYPLPAGRVDLFNGGAYLGAGRLDATAQNAPLSLNFGVDESLKVKRTTLSEQSRSAGLFGSKRRFTYAYRLELASFGPKPASVELQEQLPVSELDDVEVSVGGQTTPGFQRDEKNGRLTWQLAFQPKEHKVVELRFEVDVPSKYDSSGL